MAEGELRNENEFSDLQAGSDDLLAEARQIVLVGVADLLNQAMDAQALQQARDLSAVLLRQVAAERLVLQSADVEFAASDDAEQCVVVRVEQVEAPVRTPSCSTVRESLSSLSRPERGSSRAERNSR